MEFERNNIGMVGYVDLDFVGDLNRRRTLTSYIFTFGSSISWRATLQAIFALFTIEAEYMNMT